jgi:hypothetical protein
MIFNFTYLKNLIILKSNEFEFYILLIKLFKFIIINYFSKNKI